MKKFIISVIHSGYNHVPETAESWHKNFSKDAALAYVNSNINKTLAYIGKAGQAGCDIVCTHEDFTNAGHYVRDFKFPGLFADLVKNIQDSLQQRLSGLAKQHSMLVAANHYEDCDGLIYNMSTMYGRNGEVLGKYKKVHLADSENWKATAGEVFNVIATDMGNIGFCTCYDMIFPETCRMLAINGADIIIHQTQGWGTGHKASPPVGEAYMRVRAAENSVYLIVSKNIQGDGSDGGRSVILDNNGEIVAESEVTVESILTVEVEPNFDLIAPYCFNNYFAGVPGCKGRMFMARKPSLYGALTSADTAVSEKFKDYKLGYTAKDGEAAMNNWTQKPEEEKRLYYW